jgi:hypothetical protein
MSLCVDHITNHYLGYSICEKIYQFSNKPIFTDYIIGNGVITSTSFGSGGYYSYTNRLLNSQKKSM